MERGDSEWKLRKLEEEIDNEKLKENGMKIYKTGNKENGKRK